MYNLINQNYKYQPPFPSQGLYFLCHLDILVKVKDVLFLAH